MSVEAQTVEYTYLGDGQTTVFPFPSKFTSNGDIVVGVDRQEQTAGYTVSGAGLASGGNVQFLAAPAYGVRISLLRKPPASQLLDFVNGQTVLEGLLDNGLDKLTMIVQYLLRTLQKSVRSSEFDGASIDVLPDASDRANKVMAFDSLGQPTLVAAQGDTTVLFASQTEAEAGTNNSEAMTPLRVKQFSDTMLPVAAYSTLSGVPATRKIGALDLVEWGNNHCALAVKSAYGARIVQSPLIGGQDQYGRLCMGLPYTWAGLDPQYYNGTTILWQSGTWDAGEPQRIFGFVTNKLLTPTNLVGLDGCDADYNGGSPSYTMRAGWYYAYFLGKSSNPFGDTKIVFSEAISLTTVRANLNANVPGSAAYDFIRKFPLAFYFDGSQFRIWAVEGGYPYLTCRYVGADCSPAWAILNAVTNTAEQTFSCASFTPDNARTITVVAKLVSGGTAGEAYIRTPGVPGTGERIYVSATAGHTVYHAFTIRTDSGRNLIYTTPAGAALSLFARAFTMSEQT